MRPAGSRQLRAVREVHDGLDDGWHVFVCAYFATVRTGRMGCMRYEYSVYGVRGTGRGHMLCHAMPCEIWRMLRLLLGRMTVFQRGARGDKENEDDDATPYCRLLPSWWEGSRTGSPTN